MKTMSLVPRVLGVSLLLTAIPLLAGLPPIPTRAPDKGKAEADLRAAWAKEHPTERVLTVESKGDPVVLEKIGARKRVVERKLKFPFEVTIRKGDNETTFEAGANYIQRGSGWVFSEIGVGNVVQKAKGGDALPPKAEVKQLLLAQLKTGDPSFEYSDAKIDDGTLGRSGQRIWYRIEGDYTRTKEGVVSQCRDADFNVSRETPDAPWVVRVDSKGRCSP